MCAHVYMCQDKWKVKQKERGWETGERKHHGSVWITFVGKFWALILFFFPGGTKHGVKWYS